MEEGSVCTAIVRLRCIDRPRRSLILRGTFKGGDWITFPVHTLGKTAVCVYRCRSAARTRPHKTHNPLYWHIRSQRTCQTFLQIHKNLLRGLSRWSRHGCMTAIYSLLTSLRNSHAAAAQKLFLCIRQPVIGAPCFTSTATFAIPESSFMCTPRNEGADSRERGCCPSVSEK